MKRAVVLINVGTPDAPTIPAVRRYLGEFLSDPKVLTMPSLLRWLLVHGIILPFRSPKSTKLYKQLWTDKGSPLLYHGKQLRDKLAQQIDADVFLAMRYGSPSLQSLFTELHNASYDELIFLPLYPQYASSTTGSTLAMINHYFPEEKTRPSISTITNFYSDSGFIKAFAERITKYNLATYDHILFSYHSLPKSHLRAAHTGKSCHECGCTEQLTVENRFCYHAMCYETSRLLAAELSLPKDSYTTAFQSRFAKGWIGPFTEDRLEELLQERKKRLLIVAPSFVADCLETTIEIGKEYRELFLSLGGEKFDLVESLNSSAMWVSYLAQKVESLTGESSSPHQ